MKDSLLASLFTALCALALFAAPASACPDDQDDDTTSAFCPKDDTGDDDTSVCPDDEDDPNT